MSQQINNILCYDKKDSVCITPKLAKLLLLHNKCLKRINLNRVESIQRDIETDNFTFNGATIVLDNDLNLIDGQIRLQACVNANKPIQSLVVYGVESAGQLTKDTGRSRNVIQILAKKGYKHPKALYHCSLILNGILTMCDESIEIKESYDKNVPNAKILEIIESFPDLIISIDRIMDNRKIYFTTFIYHLIIFDYLCRFIDGEPAIADDFLDAFGNKKQCNECHPALQLRNIYMNYMYKSTNQMNKKKQLALLIKAYNLVKENKLCSRLVMIGSELPVLNMIKTSN